MVSLKSTMLALLIPIGMLLSEDASANQDAPVASAHASVVAR